MELDAIQYQLELRDRVTLPETFNPMQTMRYNEEVTDGEKIQA